MAKAKLPQRIAQFALRNAQRTVWALVLLGISAFLLLPLAANKCYLDEKALLVGGALPTVRCGGGRQAPATAGLRQLYSAATTGWARRA